MFDIGQKVLCVDDKVRHPEYYHETRLSNGSIYTIIKNTINPFYHNAHGVFISEVETPSPYGFYADRFRPIDDPAIEIFREMARKPAKEDVA